MYKNTKGSRIKLFTTQRQEQQHEQFMLIMMMKMLEVGHLRFYLNTEITWFKITQLFIHEMNAHWIIFSWCYSKLEGESEWEDKEICKERILMYLRTQMQLQTLAKVTMFEVNSDRCYFYVRLSIESQTSSGLLQHALWILHCWSSSQETHNVWLSLNLRNSCTHVLRFFQ